MGTERRQRQKERRLIALEERRKAEKRAAARRQLFTVAGIVLSFLLLLGLLWVFSDRDGTSTADSTSTTSGTPSTSAAESVLATPPAGATADGEAPCPAVDGSAERTTQFAQAPNMCIDPAKAYKAEFVTSAGVFSADLNVAAAPNTVNNFVFLARYHFYDGIPFHRIVPDFVIQAGDPIGEPWGSHGPGYTIGEEPPASGQYNKYDLAMAKTAEPNSTGSQFFVVTGDPTALNQTGTYSLFGSVTTGQEVVDAIAATSVSGDTPNQEVLIQSVTITEV